MITNEAVSIIEKFIIRLEESIQIGVDENISPNDPDYSYFKEKSFKEAIEYAVEMLFRLQQNHCD